MRKKKNNIYWCLFLIDQFEGRRKLNSCAQGFKFWLGWAGYVVSFTYIYSYNFTLIFYCSAEHWTGRNVQKPELELCAFGAKTWMPSIARVHNRQERWYTLRFPGSRPARTWKSSSRSCRLLSSLKEALPYSSTLTSVQLRWYGTRAWWWEQKSFNYSPVTLCFLFWPSKIHAQWCWLVIKTNMFRGSEVLYCHLPHTVDHRLQFLGNIWFGYEQS